MRMPFAHAAVIATGADDDIGAPGGAITLALCGAWEHDGPCPIAPHHTSARPDTGRVALRILFAAEPEREAEVRGLIASALAAGELRGPDGRLSRWQLVSDERSTLLPDEHDHAARLSASEPSGGPEHI